MHELATQFAKYCESTFDLSTQSDYGYCCRQSIVKRFFRGKIITFYAKSLENHWFSRLLVEISGIEPLTS